MIKDLLEGKKARQVIEGDENITNGNSDEEKATSKELVLQDLKNSLRYEIEMMEQEIGKLERYIDVTESIKQRLSEISIILMKLKEEGETEISARDYLTRGLK